MKTILAAIDFSAVSETVVNEAASLAQALDARVVLLTVVQPPVALTEYAALMDLGQVTAANERNAARELEKLEDRLRNRFIKTEAIQLTGAPVAHIVQQAAKLEADYIVMGSHGHTAFYDLIVGSTTHGVLLRAKCPLVIVPATQAPQEKRSTRRQAAAN